MSAAAPRPMLLGLLTCLCLVAHAAKHSCPGSKAAADRFLKDFLAQLTPKAFFKEYWGQEPVVLTGHSLGRDYSGLFSVDDLEALVDADSVSPKRLQKGRPLEYLRHLRLDGRSLGDAEQEAVDLPAEGASAQFLLGRLRGLLARGWTVVLNKAYSFWQPVLDFVMALERHFEVRVHGNIYVTPQQFTGTPIHWDSTDVFFVQLSGRKRWRVWAPFVRDTLDSEEATHTASDGDERQVWMAMRELLLDETLLPGDVLYIPRGFLHEGSVPEAGAEGPSVHLTVSPQLGTWSDFLRETPLAGLAGQPEPPGKGHFVSSAGFKPSEDFERLVTLNGTPQSLRKFLPVKLTHWCSEKKFRQLALQKLSALDPAVKPAQVSQRLADYDRQIASTGRDSNVVADVCHSYAAVLLRGLLSSSEEAAPEHELDLDAPLCLSSPAAARIVPAWMSPPGFEKSDKEAVLIHSAVNGPVRRSQVAPTAAEQSEDLPSLPLRVSAKLEAVLAAALHSERNPSGVVRPRQLLEQAHPEDHAALVAALQQLLARRVLQPSSAAERTDL